jgi:hypothetical protein
MTVKNQADIQHDEYYSAFRILVVRNLVAQIWWMFEEKLAAENDSHTASTGLRGRLTVEIAPDDMCDALGFIAGRGGQ